MGMCGVRDGNATVAAMCRVAKFGEGLAYCDPLGK